MFWMEGRETLVILSAVPTVHCRVRFTTALTPDGDLVAHDTANSALIKGGENGSLALRPQYALNEVLVRLFCTV